MMKTMMKVVMTASIVAVTIAACRPDAPDPGGAIMGKSFYVDMTDNPANYGRLDVEITGVDVYHDTRGWITLNSSVRSVNVLSLANGVTTNLAANNSAATGHYSRLRIRFGPNNKVQVNSAVDVGGVHIDAGGSLLLKWGRTTHYVDVFIDEQVTADRGARITLDFDAEQSVIETPTAYLLNPVITVMSNLNSGVRGSAVGGNTAAFINLRNDVNQYSAYATVEGRFLLRGVTPGHYSATIRVMKRNPDTGLLVEKRIEIPDVAVRSGVFTDMGTIRF